MKNTSNDLFVTTAIFNARSKPKRKTIGARTSVAGLIFFFSVSPSLSFSDVLLFLAHSEMISLLSDFPIWVGGIDAAVLVCVIISFEGKK